MVERGTDGKFLPGNPGGPGRPPRLVERDYLLALSDACPLDRWQHIVEKAIRQAEGGDAQARAWLAKYLCAGATLSKKLSDEELTIEIVNMLQADSQT